MKSLLSVAFSVNFFQWDWTMRTEYMIMLVVYKEMKRDGAKSNLAKWNLIGEIKFKHVKNCLMFK